MFLAWSNQAIHFAIVLAWTQQKYKRKKKKRDAYMNDWDEPKPWSWRLAVTNLLTGKRLELYNKGLDLQFDVITTYR